MLYTWINEAKVAPTEKGQRAFCRDCGGVLIAVVPVENIKHWRHQAGDCDLWSESEGPWHLWWKERFDLGCREVNMIDVDTNERHRADVVCNANNVKGTVLELQHSVISEEEIRAREIFYQRKHRMFWLVHVHNDNSFAGHNFRLSLDLATRTRMYDNREFMIVCWMGRSKQFIEKWKRATAHVFFDWGGNIFYLASNEVSKHLGGPFARGEFALCALSINDFIKAVNGKK